VRIVPALEPDVGQRAEVTFDCGADDSHKFSVVVNATAEPSILTGPLRASHPDGFGSSVSSDPVFTCDVSRRLNDELRLDRQRYGKWSRSISLSACRPLDRRLRPSRRRGTSPSPRRVILQILNLVRRGLAADHQFRSSHVTFS
jgi:hypothetical protein